jgi:serine/threonine-protein kinase
MGSAERRVFGKYRVLARLGRGGMGDVYLAVNIGPAGVSKLIVVKELRDQLASVTEARSMFLDEARIATRLNHPNVVQTFEVVEDGESLYLTMEYLEGQPFQNLVRGAKRSLVPTSIRLRILADTLAALHYAHELTDYDGTPLNVVHRDVSPHNVIVTYDGTAKLVDFGIAKAADAKTVTESGIFKGKVRFSSPEQIGGTETVDRRSDVFAAGAVLWEILTGEQMWKGLPDTKVLLELASGRIPAPRSADPEIPAALDAICTKAMAFVPEDRYATANDFREAILDYLKSTEEAETPVAEVMAAAFGDQRREMRAIVDAEIRSVREATSESIRMRRVPLISVPPVDGPTRATGMAHAKSSRGAPSSKVVVPVALLVCALLAAAIYGSFPGRPARSALPPAASLPTAAPMPSGVAPLVRVRLSTHPAGAHLKLDGVPLATNPYESSMPPDVGTHKILAEADGFEPREIETTFERDVVLDLALAPAVAQPAAASASAPVSARPRPGRPVAAPAHSAAPTPAATRTQRAIEEEDPYKK